MLKKTNSTEIKKESNESFSLNLSKINSSMGFSDENWEDDDCLSDDIDLPLDDCNSVSEILKSQDQSETLLLEESDSILNVAFSENNDSITNLANITECSENTTGIANETIEKLEDKPKFKTKSILELLEFTTQEPWPKDVKLFQPYEVEQILLPDNANCLAVQAFLKMCNLEFQVEPRANAEAMSPSGKVPFIKAGAFVVAELQDIVQFANKKGITLTDKLDTDQKSDIRAYMSLVHNVLEIAELYICWCDRETYNEVTSVRHGSIYPWPLNHIQNFSKKMAVVKKLRVLGWYGKTTDDVFQEVTTCCQALHDRLEDNEYFFGDRPTELDALVFGHLFTILTTPLPNSRIANIVRGFPKLVNLVQRIEREYFKRETKH